MSDRGKDPLSCADGGVRGSAGLRCIVAGPPPFFDEAQPLAAFCSLILRDAQESTGRTNTHCRDLDKIAFIIGIINLSDRRPPGGHRPKRAHACYSVPQSPADEQLLPAVNSYASKPAVSHCGRYGSGPAGAHPNHTYRGSTVLSSDKFVACGHEGADALVT
jgi:hypothetical protein